MRTERMRAARGREAAAIFHGVENVFHGMEKNGPNFPRGGK